MPLDKMHFLFYTAALCIK